MKNAHLLGLAAMVSMSVACAAQTSNDPTGERSSQVTGGAGGDSAPVDPSAPDAAPPVPSQPDAAPPPPAPDGPDAGPACLPLAQHPGSVNPASVYCTDLGYQLQGEQCTFPNGTSCEEWAFYRGECGQEHSFCALHGGTVANKLEDMGGWTASYALCTLPGGKQCQDDAFAHSCSCN